ncbi:polysaccharide biosynthesis protein [Cryobacterium sp. TMT1-21]|uniref:polysaccharide biosynthesis protein n=1 Tax=Cryobacterium sp. TMT1-21 TaxID=1259234 RepID=UPI00141B012B|nr:polysaccharide biosynthesis protein [Cryobacterium sp. TMT1-21]
MMKQPWRTSDEEKTAMPASETTIGARGASGIGVASAIAAAAGFLISLVVARTLSPADTAQFLIFWGLLFGLFGTLSGIQSETTRAVRSAVLADRVGRGRTSTRVLPAGLIVGAVVSAALLASSALWAEKLFPAGSPWVIMAVALAGFAYSGHATLAGAAAGSQNWRLYSWLMGSESLVRFLCVVAVALTTATVVGVEVACTLASLVWIVFLVISREARGAIRARSDVALPALLRQHSYALVSAAATAALIVGFPIMFSLTSSPAAVASSAGLLLAVQLTRAPIMIPLQAFQGVAIASFVNQRDRGLRALGRPVGLIIGISVVGAVLAWWIGPWLMLIFGPGYVVGGAVLALLTLGAGGMAVLTLTGAAALASGLHRVYTLGWTAATFASFVLLMIPASSDVRVTLSLCVSPLIGILVHGLGIPVAGGRRQPPRIEDVT